MSQKWIVSSWNRPQVLNLLAVFLYLGNFLLLTLASPHPHFVLYRNLLDSHQNAQDYTYSSKVFTVFKKGEDKDSDETDDCDDDDDDEDCQNRRFWKNFGIIVGVVVAVVIILIVMLYICTKKLRKKQGKKFFWTRKSEIRAAEETASTSNVSTNRDTTQNGDPQQNISPFVLPCQFSPRSEPPSTPNQPPPSAPGLSPLNLELDQIHPTPPVYTERDLPPPYDFSEKQLEKTYSL